MAALTPTAKMQFFKADGIPLAGGKLYTYTAGTTTPQTTYTDSSGGTANTNPVILDSRGEANIWLGGATYKFKLTDANDVEIWTVDNISAPTSGVSPALSGNVTIDTNSSSPALKITQTGTGYAMRVQDSTDPDLTPFVIDNTGRLGLGTTSPAEALDIDNSGKIQFSASGAARMIISCDASDSIFDVSGARNYVVKTNSTTILTGNTTDITTTVPVVLPGSPTTSLQAATKTYVDTAQTTAGPPGAIIAFAGTSAPTGWLACQGQAVSRSVYAALFAAIGTTWGAGDGSTTFNLPDLRGVFLRGTGTNSTGSSSGAVGPSVGTYAVDTYLNHSHGVTDPGHTHLINIYNTGQGTTGGGAVLYPLTPGLISTNSNTTGLTVNTSTTGGTETKPKNYGILYIIKT